MSLKAIRQRLSTDTKFFERDPAAPAPIAPSASVTETLERKERERQPQSPKNGGEFGAIGAEGADASPSESEFGAKGAIGATFSAFAPDVLEGREFDISAFAECASIMEYDGGMPRAEADHTAAHELGYRTEEALDHASVEAWLSEIAATPQTGIHDFDRLATVSLRFLESEWAMKALAADWDETALFAVHEGQSPKERIDAWGLIPLLAWGIHKPSIISFDANACLLRPSAGEPLRQPRSRANFDEAVPWWRHLGIKDAKGNSHE